MKVPQSSAHTLLWTVFKNLVHSLLSFSAVLQMCHSWNLIGVRSGKVLRVCFSKHVENTDIDDMIWFLKQFAPQDWPEFNSVIRINMSYEKQSGI